MSADGLCSQLLEAVQRGDLSQVKRLVSLGADARRQDDTALRTSAGNGQLEVVKYLVSLGANVRAQDDCALRWSAFNGQLEVVQYLVYDMCYGVTNEFALKTNLIDGTPCGDPFRKELARRAVIQGELSSLIPSAAAAHHLHNKSTRIKAMNDIIQRDVEQYMTEREYWDIL